MWNVEKTTAEKMKPVADALLSAESMYIVSHIVADGDAMGSCAALCHEMRKLGKKADVLFEDSLAENLLFLDNDYVTYVDEDTQLETRDLCVAIDCNNISRFPKREHIYFGCGRQTVCIDHHATGGKLAEIDYVDPDAAATAEIMYELLITMGIKPDAETCEAIYTGISTDTGRFQYANTSKKTHLITAELYDSGIEPNKLNVILYQSERAQKLKLRTLIMSTIEVLCGGLLTMAYVSLDMYRKADAHVNESDGMNALIKDIKGVELAIFFREVSDSEVKVGFRSKEYIDVSEFSTLFGGGGHEHAAGCTIYANLDETIEMMRDAAVKYVEAFEADHPAMKRIAEAIDE